MAMVVLAASAAVLAVVVAAGIELTAQITPSPPALADIPSDYLQVLVAAATSCPGLSWTVPAAIGKVESDFGRAALPGVTSGANPAGAAGPMQMGIEGPAGPTFYLYDHPIPADLAATPAGGTAPPSPYNPVDAIYAAVRDLCANGAGDPAHLYQAVLAYNHSAVYASKVLALAASYANLPAVRSAVAQAVISYALAQLGTPYRWGGEGNGGFDCSGLVQAAYAYARVGLPRVAQAQYDAGPLIPPGMTLQPADLVFFGKDPNNVTHVGIVVGNGEMIDAPHTGAVVRVEPYDWPDYIGATRPDFLTVTNMARHQQP